MTWVETKTDQALFNGSLEDAAQVSIESARSKVCVDFLFVGFEPAVRSSIRNREVDVRNGDVDVRNRDVVCVSKAIHFSRVREHARYTRYTIFFREIGSL